MKVALTGATGFVGAATLDRLIEAGHEVRALTRRDQPPREGVTWVRGALEDAGSLDTLCEGADAVLHVAGVVSARDAAGFETGNVAGTELLIEAAEHAGVRRFVHVSSLSAREPQLSLYGASKRRGEDRVTASRLDWAVVRPPAVYGPGDTEMVDSYRAAARGIAPMPPKGRVSLIHVDDLARLLVALVDAERAGGLILEPDDGRAEGWSHADYARLIGDAVGRAPLVLHLPAPLLRLAAAADELIRRDRAKLTRDRAAYLVHRDWVASADKRPDPDLWRPEISTARGIAETADWYRDRGWL